MRLSIVLYGNGNAREALYYRATLDVGRHPDWELLPAERDTPEALRQPAEEAAGEWLLFLRDNRMLTGEDADRLLAEAETAGAALAGPRLLRPDGGFDSACKRGLPLPGSAAAYLLRLDRLFPRSRRLGRYRQTWLAPEATGLVECLSLSCMLVRRSLWQRLGGLDADLGRCGPEVDFCARAADTGAKVLYCGDVVSRSRAQGQDVDVSPEAMAESMLAYYNKHLAAKRGPLAGWCMRLAVAAWRLSVRLRLRFGKMKNRFRRILGKVPGAFRYLRHFGLKATLLRTREQGRELLAPEEYTAWNRQRQPTPADRKAQSDYVFDDPPLISIVTPVYNTPEPYLEEMAASVIGQSYARWELVLADGGSTLPGFGERLAALAALDSRIRPLRFEDNLGISGNTNRGIEAARGEIIAFMDHDDIITPDALFEVAWAFRKEGAAVCYSDEDKMNDLDSAHPYGPFFKPDYFPENLTSMNYISHFSAVSAALLRQAGLLRPAFDGSQDHELMLRLSRATSAIVHIPRVLYHWRQFSNSVSKSRMQQCVDAGIRAVAEHWTALGMEVESVTYDPAGYHTRFVPSRLPRVSALIPNKDHADDLRRCIAGLKAADYPDWEAVIVENHSVEPETFALYRELEQDSRIRVLEWDKPFHYSAINNFAAASATGELLLLLNNDVEMTCPLWLRELVTRLSISGVGAVGGRLLYPNGTLQHGGVVLGLGGVAGHINAGAAREDNGYFGRLVVLWNVSAVTGALLLTPAALYRQLGGLEEALAVAFNDVDYCLKVREAGLRILYVPEAEGIHRESVSRGREDTSEKMERFQKEVDFMREKWGGRLVDPCYSPNLTLSDSNCALRREDTPRTRLHP